MIGVRVSLAQRRMRETSSVVVAKTTADGPLRKRRRAVEGIGNDVLRLGQNAVRREDGRKLPENFCKIRHGNGD